MKFDINTALWTYDLPAVGSGSNDLAWGPYDQVNSNAVLAAYLVMLQNSVAIGPPDGWEDVLEPLQDYANTTYRYPNGYIREPDSITSPSRQGWPTIVKDADSGNLVDMRDKSVYVADWLKEMQSGTIGSFLQKRTNYYNIFFSTKKCSLSGTWPSDFNAYDVLRYEVSDKTNKIIDQYLDTTLIASLSGVNVGGDFVFPATSGWSLIIPTGVWNSVAITDSSSYDFPTRLSVKGIIRQKPISKCVCDYGFKDGQSCRECFGLGYIGIMPGDIEYVPLDLTVDWNNPTKSLYTDIKLNYITKPLQGYALSVLNASTYGDIFVRLPSVGSNPSLASYSFLEGPFYPIQVEVLQNALNDIVDRWDDYVPGTTNISFEDATGISSPSTFYDDVEKFNFGTPSYTGTWPANKLGFTPISAKHFEPFANTFTRCYFGYWDDSTGQAVVNDCIGSVKTGAAIEWNYSLKEVDGNINIVGYPYSPTRATATDTITSEDRHNPGQFLWTKTYGDGDSVISSATSYSYSLFDDGSIYYYDQSTDTKGVLVSNLPNNNNITLIAGSKLFNGSILIKPDTIVFWSPYPNYKLRPTFYHEINVPGIKDIIKTQNSSFSTYDNALGLFVKDQWIANINDQLYACNLRVGPYYWIDKGINNRISIAKGYVHLLSESYANGGSGKDHMYVESSINSFTNAAHSGFIYASSYDYENTFDDNGSNSILIDIAKHDDVIYALTDAGLNEIDFDNKSFNLRPWDPVSLSGIMTHPAANISQSLFNYNGSLYLHANYGGGSIVDYKLSIGETITATVDSTPASSYTTIKDDDGLGGYWVNFSNDGLMEKSYSRADQSFNIVLPQPHIHLYGSGTIRGHTPLISDSNTDIFRIGYNAPEVNIGYNAPEVNMLRFIRDSSDIELEIGAEIPHGGTPKFLISGFDGSNSTALPYYGHTYHYATPTHIKTKSIPDNNLVGKLEHRSGASLKHFKVADPEFNNLSDDYGHSRRQHILTSVSSSGYYSIPIYRSSPHLTNHFIEFGAGDLDCSCRGLGFNYFSKDRDLSKTLYRSSYSYPADHLDRYLASTSFHHNFSNFPLLRAIDYAGVSFTYESGYFSLAETSIFLPGANSVLHDTFMSPNSSIGYTYFPVAQKGSNQLNLKGGQRTNTMQFDAIPNYSSGVYYTGVYVQLYCEQEGRGSVDGIVTGYNVGVASYWDGGPFDPDTVSSLPYIYENPAVSENISVLDFTPLGTEPSSINFFSLLSKYVGEDGSSYAQERDALQLLHANKLIKSVQSSSSVQYVNHAFSNPLQIPNYIGHGIHYMYGNNNGTIKTYDPWSGEEIVELTHDTGETDDILYLCPVYDIWPMPLVKSTAQYNGGGYGRTVDGVYPSYWDQNLIKSDHSQRVAYGGVLASVGQPVIKCRRGKYYQQTEDYISTATETDLDNFDANQLAAASGLFADPDDHEVLYPFFNCGNEKFYTIYRSWAYVADGDNTINYVLAEYDNITNSHRAEELYSYTVTLMYGDSPSDQFSLDANDDGFFGISVRSYIAENTHTEYSKHHYPHYEIEILDSVRHKLGGIFYDTNAETKHTAISEHDVVSAGGIVPPKITALSHDLDNCCVGFGIYTADETQLHQNNLYFDGNGSQIYSAEINTDISTGDYIDGTSESFSTQYTTFSATYGWAPSTLEGYSFDNYTYTFISKDRYSVNVFSDQIENGNIAVGLNRMPSNNANVIDEPYILLNKPGIQ